MATARVWWPKTSSMRQALAKKGKIAGTCGARHGRRILARGCMMGEGHRHHHSDARHCRQQAGLLSAVSEILDKLVT